MSPGPPELCAECGSPLAEHQRYCLMCGSRHGSASPLLGELQRRVAAAGGSSPPAGAPAQADRPSAGAGIAPLPGKPRAAGLRLPPARISALLVLIFLGFGVLMGDVAGSPVQGSLAASVRRLKVVLPPSVPTVSTSTTGGEATSPSSSATGSEVQAPESEAATTPEAPVATTSTPAQAPPATQPSSGKASEPGESAPPEPAKKLPPIKHVFVIMLSDQPYASVFGPSSGAPYLSGTLEHRGTLLVRYDAVAHEELADEIALLSGQGPTAETAANCPSYSNIVPTGTGADEQVLGSGCVYPPATHTLPGQLTESHLAWRAYVEGMGEAGAAAPSACSHPAVGAPDPTAAQTASTGPYATFRNPFVYFQAIAGSPACGAEDVGLSHLKGDLASSARTANLTYIVPDRCHDANPTPCTTGAPAGLAPANGFLKEVVPEILASRAYKQNGLLVITVDEAPSSGELADSSGCCGQPSFPNTPPTGASVGLRPQGGGTVGALLLSPYLKGATTSQEPYNHFSLLRTIEDLFGLKHLGYAALPTVKSFEAAMFSSRKLG